jgi:hypothetical protein
MLDWLTYPALPLYGKYRGHLVPKRATFDKAAYITASPNVFCRDAVSKQCTLTGKQFCYSRPEVLILARTETIEAESPGSKR